MANSHAPTDRQDLDHVPRGIGGRPLNLEILARKVRAATDSQQGVLNTLLTSIGKKIVTEVATRISVGMIPRNGKLNPRNIIIRMSTNEPGKYMLEMGRFPDVVSLSSDDYDKIWLPRDPKCTAEEAASFAASCLVYFVMTGQHPYSFAHSSQQEVTSDEQFQMSHREIDYIFGNMTSKRIYKWINELKKGTIEHFMAPKNALKIWKEKLLYDLIANPIFQCGDIIQVKHMAKHPFFWTLDEVNIFFMRVATFLEENSGLAKGFNDGWRQGNWKDVTFTFHKKGKNKQETERVESIENVIKDFILANPDRVEPNREPDTLSTLIIAIRNKATHWHDEGNRGNQDYAKKRKRFIKCLSKLELGDRDLLIYPDKYILLWMFPFEGLLLHTWEKLREVIKDYQQFQYLRRIYYE